MRRTTILALRLLAVVSSILLSACDDAGSPAPLDSALTVAQWREDLRTVAREVPRTKRSGYRSCAAYVVTVRWARIAGAAS